jgi:hypothetical protein
MSFGLPKAPPMKTEQENYPKCRTCRHWFTGIRKDSTIGICDLIEESDKDDAPHISADGNLASLRTPQDFGCILHEPVTTGSQ